MKKLLLLAMTVQMAVASMGYDDLIGKKEQELNNDIFLCRHHICSATEQEFIDIPLLDKTVQRIETYSDEQGTIYEVHLHVAQVGEFENRDLTQAFFRAIEQYGKDRGKVLECSLEYVFDKYGNKSLVKIVDPVRRDTYRERMKRLYLEALKSGIKQ